MKAIDNVGITFANRVISRGYLNGVINMELAAYQFTAVDSTPPTVDPDPAIVCRLRLDYECAVEIRDHLTQLIEAMDRARGASQAKPTLDDAVSETKPN